MPKEKQSAFERVLLSRWFLFTLLIVMIIVAVGYARAYYADYQVRAQISALEKEVQNLQKKKFNSLELLERAKTENFLEEKAKTELNLKKPGENVLIIPEIKTQANEELTTEPVDEDRLSNPLKWWYYFTDKRNLNQP